MRYMIIVRATPMSEAGIIPDDPQLMADMADSMLSGGQRVSATAYVNPDGEVVLIE